LVAERGEEYSRLEFNNWNFKTEKDDNFWANAASSNGKGSGSKTTDAIKEVLAAKRG